MKEETKEKIKEEAYDFGKQVGVGVVTGCLLILIGGLLSKGGDMGSPSSVNGVSIDAD